MDDINFDSNGVVIIVDNFYENPDEKVYHALQEKLHNHGYHPGMRTVSSFNEEAAYKLTKIMNRNIYPSGDSYAYQFNTSYEVSWIHTDICLSEMELNKNKNKKSWAAVIYLKKNAPLECGTCIYREKQFGYENLHDFLINNNRNDAEYKSQQISDTGSDISNWEESIFVGNVYNRCVIYNANYFHQARKYFGFVKEDSRLIQVIFFSTFNEENDDKKIIQYNKIQDTNYIEQNYTNGVLDYSGFLTRFHDEEI